MLLQHDQSRPVLSESIPVLELALGHPRMPVGIADMDRDQLGSIEPVGNPFPPHHDTALVLSKQSGVAEVLHNVLKYDFWDVERLADQIVGVATSPALKTSLKQNVMQEYAQLSWDDVAAQLHILYGAARQPRERVLV